MSDFRNSWWYRGGRPGWPSRVCSMGSGSYKHCVAVRNPVKLIGGERTLNKLAFADGLSSILTNVS